MGCNASMVFKANGAASFPESFRIHTLEVSLSLMVTSAPLWYSPNTYNGAMYLVKGLNRLKGYAPVLEEIAKERDDAMMGDDDAFEYFEKNAEKYCFPENGYAGIFYLHPNAKGAKKLAKFWTEGIVDALD